ncbi:MAG: hypothetical protein JWN34_668, partial [Bryobacterales bacterium]|nr:hypothetical protein [Bryobacterales bacterium]
TTATSPTALSVDFVGTGNSLAANEVAGVIPKSNWNSASGAASTTPLNLKSEAGSATGATVTWASDNAWRTPVADVAGNNRMMSGYLDNGQGNPSTVRLAGITPGNYDILVYIDGDNPSTSRTGSYQISGSGIATRTINATDTQNTTFSGAFIASNNATGNYVIFNGVTISSGFTLTGTPGATGDVPRAPINGIQIVPAGAASSNGVPTPTPSTPTLSIGTATIPGGQASIQYSTTLIATGGTAPYNWAMSAGTLPTGLALSTSSGNISGTPAVGSYSFTVRVRDNSGQEATKAYSVSIQPAASTSPAASTYYVAAQNGNDAWSGQLPSPNGTNTDGPFLTLRRAQTAMQSSTRKVATIRGGTYSVASGMSFAASDNGETWIAYPGETAVLDGGGQGSIRIGNASRMTFEGLTLRNMGADGFFIDYGDAFTFRSNVFTNCRLGCITGNFLTNSVLDSNTIDGQSPGNPAGNTGNAYSAIHLYGTSSNNRITHNLIKNTEGGGIGLNNSPTQGGCSNNIIDRNLLQNVDTNVVDFGAIYIYDPSHGGTGNQITNNIVDVYGGPNGVANGVKGIYLDDLTSNVLVSGNLVRNGGAWAFMIHGGDRNTVTNNVWDLSSSGTLLAFYQSSPFGSFGMTSNVFTKNLVYSGSTYPSSLYLIYKGAGDAPLAPSNNLYHSATGAAIPNTGMVDSNRILSNPLFAAPSSGNYAMPASSPAYTAVGFAPLPTDQGPLPR